MKSFKTQLRRNEHILKPDKKKRNGKYFQIIIWQIKKQRKPNETKLNAYKSLSNLDTRERDICKLAQTREKKSRDLGDTKYIKSEDNRIFVREMRLKKARNIFTNFMMKTQLQT